MIRGTTPTHIYNIPFDAATIKEVKITYAQVDKIILEKYTKDCVIEDQKITTKLTQEETFQFDCKLPVYIQVRVLTQDDEAVSSSLITIEVSKCLDSEVLQ